MKKLNFGCGSIQPEGWDNLDRDSSFLPNGKCLNSTEFLETESFDIIVAHCALQMNDWRDLPGVLSDLHRILKPGGVLRISLPDIESGFEEYRKGNISFFPNGEDNIHLRFSAWLTWYSTTKTLLTRGSTFELLKNAGFSEISVVGFNRSKLGPPEIKELDTRDNECYFMEARK